MGITWTMGEEHRGKGLIAREENLIWVSYHPDEGDRRESGLEGINVRGRGRECPK